MLCVCPCPWAHAQRCKGHGADLKRFLLLRSSFAAGFKRFLPGRSHVATPPPKPLRIAPLHVSFGRRRR